MIYTISRQVGILIPLCLILSKEFGLTGVWVGYALTDYLAFLIVLIMSVIFRRRVLDKWPAKVE